eukprot:COSAG04_NODE_1532_length_6439_cov_1.468139_2_plen_179_part_00
MHVIFSVCWRYKRAAKSKDKDGALSKEVVKGDLTELGLQFTEDYIDGIFDAKGFGGNNFGSTISYAEFEELATLVSKRPGNDGPGNAGGGLAALPASPPPPVAPRPVREMEMGMEVENPVAAAAAPAQLRPPPSLHSLVAARNVAATLAARKRAPPPLPPPPAEMDGRRQVVTDSVRL